MRVLVRFLWVLLAVLPLALPVWAAGGDRVVAVVNDQVITLNQLNARVQLAKRQAGMGTLDAAQELGLKKRTLATLIDEELQEQFAASSKLNVDKMDLMQAQEQAMQAMGADKWAALGKGLESTVNDKMRAEVLWRKIMTRNVQPSVNVSTAEADRLIEELSKSRHVLEREISMIVINPADDAEDKAQLARVKEIRERIVKGAKFADEAKANSEDKSAVNGGNLGWFATGELNPQLEEALDKMQPGEVSEPIRTPMGWHLIKLENVRTTKPVETTAPVTQLELYMLAAPTPSDPKVLSETMDKAVKALRKPEEVREYFAKQQYGDTFAASSVLGWTTPSDLQTELSNALAGVKVGEWSNEVELGPNMARIYVAATQQAMPRNLEVYREKVLQNLTAQRTELAARRFMRELRQKAFVDVRL